MSTTLHETPTRPSSPRPPRRRPVAVFVAGAVLVVAIGVGAALALGGHGGEQVAPVGAAAAQPAADQATKVAASTPASRGTASGQPQQGSGQPQKGSGQPQKGSGQAQSSTPSGHPKREGVTTLTDGRYNAYVRKVDPDRDLIVVDLVQVFTGDAAVRAALEDGMDGSAAEVRDTYVRNQNDRLRTLEMAGGVRLNLIGSCESTGQEALFTKLIKDATYGQGQLFYYTLGVQGGVVQRIDEHQAQPAC
jgi:hypothetical protein